MAQAFAPAASRAKRNGNGALKSRADDVLADFDELKKDVGKLAEAANKAVRREIRGAKEHLAETRHSLEQEAQGRAEALGDQVRERPLAALGIAAGAGLVIGFLLRR